jgi:hypothetical protein
MTEQSETAVHRWAERHPKLAYYLATALQKYLSWREWRAECPSCGESRDKLIPGGWTCLNADCEKFLL